ncbi:MAG: hypothetical protein BIFFINMI_00946 [Phycisphaerae bacterium]|nr:hypothetical protein [Phycisphaerae bacterium]
MKSNPWIQTFNGRQVFPLAPDPDQIDIHDIAHALANLCRFTGHTRQFYSVAQHSVLVARECPPESQAWGLLHDAAEAYINDIARPIKQRTCIETLSGAIRWIDEIEHAVMGAVARRFNLPWPMPEGCMDAVKHVDTRLLLTEKRDLMSAEPAGWDVEGDPFLGWHIDPWPPQRAEREFLRAALDYGIVTMVGVPPSGEPAGRPILDEAAEITSADRRQAYGHPLDNFSRIAATWDMVLGPKLRDDALISPQDVAKCMIGLKLARESFAHRRDNLVDIAGYARTLAIVEGDEE